MPPRGGGDAAGTGFGAAFPKPNGRPATPPMPSSSSKPTTMLSMTRAQQQRAGERADLIAKRAPPSARPSTPPSAPWSGLKASASPSCSRAPSLGGCSDGVLGAAARPLLLPGGDGRRDSIGSTGSDELTSVIRIAEPTSPTTRKLSLGRNLFRRQSRSERGVVAGFRNNAAHGLKSAGEAPASGSGAIALRAAAPTREPSASSSPRPPDATWPRAAAGPRTMAELAERDAVLPNGERIPDAELTMSAWRSLVTTRYGPEPAASRPRCAAKFPTATVDVAAAVALAAEAAAGKLTGREGATTPLSALSDDSTRSSGLSSERFHDGMIDEAALAEYGELDDLEPESALEARRADSCGAAPSAAPSNSAAPSAARRRRSSSNGHAPAAKTKD